MAWACHLALGSTGYISNANVIKFSQKSKVVLYVLLCNSINITIFAL